METRADHQSSDDPLVPPPAAYPRWILLDEYFQKPNTKTVASPAADPVDDLDNKTVASPAADPVDDRDTMTVAHARTSKGRPISISFVLATPPAVSGLRLQSPGLHLQYGVNSRCHAIAAHMDTVLLRIEIRNAKGYDDDGLTSDHFLYCAGDAAADPARPPSLSLLPPFYLADMEEGRPKETHYLDEHGTALLRRGQDELLVAALGSFLKEEDHVLEAKLFLLRSDEWEWELKQLPVIHEAGKRVEIACWRTDNVIPVRDRLVLWVDSLRGIIYSDLWQETTELRYVSLPVEPDLCSHYDRGGSSHRSVCATEGGAAVRFVDVSPRCCCGCPVATHCTLSRHAFMVTIWALNMDDMTTWDKVCVVDCHELWSLPGYHGVMPRIKPEHPTLNMYDPDILCFVVHKTIYDEGVDGDLGTRLVEIDTRHMELCSTSYYGPEFYMFSSFVASTVSQYFDASSLTRGASARRKDVDLQVPATPLKLNLRRVASPEEMLAMLQEIPDLEHDEMMKSYGVLSSDENQFKFRSLLALPVDMRKDYCLLIGKLSSFYV